MTKEPIEHQVVDKKIRQTFLTDNTISIMTAQKNEKWPFSVTRGSLLKLSVIF
jgi:hypothetical protein